MDEEMEPPMMQVQEIVADDIIKLLPTHVGTMEISASYLGGTMQWMQEAYVITSPDHTMEVSFGHFDGGGIMKEILFMDKKLKMTPKERATMGNMTIYDEFQDVVETSRMTFGETP